VQAVETPLKLAQTAAIAEVLHAGVGLVRSPVLITATQVASRIWILWGIVNAAPDAITARSISLLPGALAGVLPSLAHRLSLSLASLLTAWSASEIIRYGFFAFKEAGLQPYFLLWLRYSGFIVLYPLGVASELSMVWLALPVLRAGNRWNVAMPNPWNFGFTYWIACVLAVAAYLPGFPQLYGYMLIQRRKILSRGGGRVQSKVKPL
jgi:very-long-chain (3R)-3-hydroxyacyl-CoA dehydratase